MSSGLPTGAFVSTVSASWRRYFEAGGGWPCSSYPSLTACGSSPSSASTKGAIITASGAPQSLHVPRVSDGPKSGMRIVGSLNQVSVDSYGDVGFGVFLTNKGTSAYACTTLQAAQIPTKGPSERVGPQNPERCIGPGQTIAPGSKAWVWFFVRGNSHAPKDIVVLPYGSNKGRMVWSVAGCSVKGFCLGSSQQVQH